MAKNKSLMYDMHTAHNLQKYEQYRYDMFQVFRSSFKKWVITFVLFTCVADLNKDVNLNLRIITKSAQSRIQIQTNYMDSTGPDPQS